MSPWVSLVLVMIVAGLGLCAGVIVSMARMLLMPPWMNDGKAVVVLRRLSPGDLNLRFLDLRFEIRDESSGGGLRIAGWWIGADGPSERTVVIIHGYADAKVGGIAWAPMFHELGWNVLAIDLRAHGESGGRYSTAGFWERHDLNQVLNRVRADRAAETKAVVLFGVSLGAAVALAASGTRDDVAGVIAEGPFASYRDAIAAHGRLHGAPGGWVQGLSIALAEWMAKADFDAVRPVDLIPKSPCPVLVFHGGEDFFMVRGESEALREAVERHGDERDGFYEFEAGHVLGLAKDPAGYRERVRGFFESVVGKTEAERAKPETNPNDERDEMAKVTRNG